MSDFLLSAAQEKLVVQNVSAKIVELILSQILEEDNFEFHMNILQLFIFSSFERFARGNTCLLSSKY